MTLDKDWGKGIQQRKLGILKYGLPDPVCPLGYPRDQVMEILHHDADLIEDFYDWMTGQTCGLCDGRRWEHSTQEYRIGCETPHGVCVYGHDFRKWLAGGGGVWD